ncbi:septal ring lytic transglycosylase RlpA family protein [Allorhizobium sp. BGMRC 0089]|uniref:septal ring lytic transglycosylase RlpA family protein n=1 Tax=Allorhizobium sonneratiae TaxID=2934936 RepID=UPI0020340687|nr:septal ring lytic transglycosylase RlpA family protein [Allorhizobium sonneratiae]MCM2291622.1 septal ring lytic transglycosylase RlpA family protein [Allorhizobium sonneratiae]
MAKTSRTGIVVAVLSGLLAFAPLPVMASASNCGGASWYNDYTRTASGERMNPTKLTAAHKYLPFGSKVRVTNRRNGKTVVVRINDRGPFIKGRVLDLSKAAAADLGMIASGTASVCYEQVG